MHKKTFFTAFFAIVFTTVLMLFYVDAQVELTELQLELPKLSKELKEITEGNRALQYEIDRLENPARLMQLLRQPEFSNLQYPCENEVILVD